MKEAKLYLDRAFAEASLTHVDTNIMNDQGVAMMAEKQARTMCGEDRSLE